MTRAITSPQRLLSSALAVIAAAPPTGPVIAESPVSMRRAVAPEKPQRLVPCANPAYRQFDFWIGDWDVFEIERPNVVVARARIESILNGCVLHEVYEGLDGHKGESFSIYDVTLNLRHQSWVNNSGYLLTIEGHLQGKSMTLEGVDHVPNNKLRQVRGEWRADEQGAHEVAWRSTDGGVSWVTWFDLSFRPHVPSSKTSANQ
jgi:hypothetical protein